MKGYNLGDVVEPDSEAFHVVYVAGGNTVEFLKDMLLVFFGNADAVVCYFADDMAGFGASGDGDMRLVVRVLNGVVDKVVRHVGYMQEKKKKGAIDVTKVGLDSAVTVLKGEFEVLNRGEHQTV